MQIRPLKYRLAMVHKLLFHPFVHPDFMDSLKRRSYTLQQLPPTIPSGPRAYVDGYIAIKDGCAIETNNEKKLIAVESSTQNFVPVMADLMTISEDDFGMDLKSDLEFMELSVNCIILTDKSPTDVFLKFRSDSFDRFTEVFKQETTLFGLRLVPNNLLPSSKDWYDVQIQPRLTKPDKEYYITMLYRSEGIERAMDFSHKINDNIASIVNLIEKG